jgi:hypothetical protein
MNGITAISIGKDNSKIRMEIGLSYSKQLETNIFGFDTFSLAFPMETMTSTF